MAVTHFIQQIWSKKIQDDLELKCKLVDNCLVTVYLQFEVLDK